MTTLTRACVTLLVVAAGLTARDARADEGLVATVGGVPITKWDLSREVQKILPLNVGFHSGVTKEKVAEIKKKALDGLIEQAYKVRWALDEELAVDPKRVTELSDAVFAKLKTEEERKKALGDETMESFRSSINRGLLAIKAEQVAVMKKVKVTDAQIREQYDKHAEGYEKPREFRASHILIKVDPSSNDEERKKLKAKAEELTAKAKAGEDFYNLAYFNSDDRTKFVGGDLGTFHEGRTIKEFEDAIKTMKAGEIKGPVETLYGYHVIKLVENKDPRKLSFEEVKDTIRKSLEQKKRESLYKAWMAGNRKKYDLVHLDTEASAK